MSVSKKYATLVICPTLNPGTEFERWVEGLESQVMRSADVLIVDSGSMDDLHTVTVENNYRLKSIKKSEFNHGGTRNAAVLENREYDFYIFLTQDAILAGEESIKNLMDRFDDPQVAAVYGRQLPREGASHIERHARLINYPEESHCRVMADAEKFGVKTAFLSNSFAAYRRDALLDVGGFPEDVIFGEDMYVAAKLLMSDYKIAYAADAEVYHSHSYTILEEFRRYFDMGVFHAHQPWIRIEFGAAEDAGLQFVISEIKYLFGRAFWRVPEAVFRTIMRYLGFRSGLLEKYMPVNLKNKFSMNSGYFK